MAAICTAAAIYINLLQPIMASIISRTGLTLMLPCPPPSPPISASPCSVLRVVQGQQ